MELSKPNTENCATQSQSVSCQAKAGPQAQPTAYAYVGLQNIADNLAYPRQTGHDSNMGCDPNFHCVAAKYLRSPLKEKPGWKGAAESSRGLQLLASIASLAGHRPWQALICAKRWHVVTAKRCTKAMWHPSQTNNRWPCPKRCVKACPKRCAKVSSRH